MRIIVKKPGRPFGRPVPPDFEIIFVEQGRLECEHWYRAGRIMVNRWLEQCGKQRLIRKRAAFVKLQRTGGTPKPKPRQPIVTRKSAKVHPLVARAAADYLRIRRNGGWMISKHGDDLWRVGITIKSAAEMVDMAERKGFDRCAANLQAKAADGVGD